MSRGIKVFYATESDSLPAGGAGQQLNDYCIVKSDAVSSTPRVIDPTTVEDFLESDTFQSRIFQWDGAAWVEKQNFSFTDEPLLPNVTKIRKAHIDDFRTFIKAIQDNKVNKYGDSYYNTHNYTNSVMLWGRDTDIARVYLGDYGSDSQWLTLEFGNNIGAYTGDRVRFMFRNGVVYDPIMDILGDQVHITKYLLVDGPLRVNGLTVLNGDANITGSLDVDTNLNVDGDTTLVGQLDVTGPTILHDTLYVETTTTLHGNATMEANLQVNGHIEADQYIATDTQFESRVATGTPPLIVASTTVVDNLNAHLLDGAHRGDTKDLVPTNNGILQGDGNETDPRYGVAGHRTGDGLNAHLLDGYHIQDVIDLVSSVTYNGTAYKDSANNLNGQSLQVKIDGTNYFVPSSVRADGVCHSSCHASCHGSCHCFRMCHMYIDEAYQKERK